MSAQLAMTTAQKFLAIGASIDCGGKIALLHQALFVGNHKIL
jgi:hypothetical protein